MPFIVKCRHLVAQFLVGGKIKGTSRAITGIRDVCESIFALTREGSPFHVYYKERLHYLCNQYTKQIILER